MIPYGYCHCGCGARTSIANRNHARKGWIKGEPLRYVLGHGTRKNTPGYRVDEATGCWIWTGCITSAGYGHAYDPGERRVRPAHRICYEQYVGPIPAGLELDHLCRNRACVNPDHLEPVTQQENIRRGVEAKGRKGFVVWRAERSRWRASIVVNAKQYSVGSFRHREDAQAALAIYIAERGWEAA